MTKAEREAIGQVTMHSKRVLQPCEDDPKGLGWHYPLYNDKTGQTKCVYCGVIIWSAA